MKKTISLLLVVLALAALLGGCGGGSGAASTTEAGKTEGNGISSKHIHCICNGKAVNVGEHKACSNNDGWVEIATAAELTDAIAGSSVKKPAYVVLTADITIDGYLEVALGKAVNICLNGKKLNASAKVVGEMNITDCAGSGSIVGDKSFTIRTYAGAVMNMYAGTITTTGSKSDTQVVVLRGSADKDLQLAEADSVFTLYGGTIQAVGTTTKSGHCVYLAVYGIMKMYDGTICNGNVDPSDASERYGGNIGIFGSYGSFTMYGGEVKDGKAHSGGNIYAYSGDLRLYGGTVSGGYAAVNYGGNICTNNKPDVLEFKNCTIKNGTAAGKFGGNMYLNGSNIQASLENVTISDGRAAIAGSNIFINEVVEATIKDCTISGGVLTDAAAEGGAGLSVQGKSFTVHLKGNVKFENNQGCDILMRYYYATGTQSWLSVAELTTKTPIVVGCAKRMEFTVDTAQNHPFVAISGMSISEVDGKLVIDNS